LPVPEVEPRSLSGPFRNVVTLLAPTINENYVKWSENNSTCWWMSTNMFRSENHVFTYNAASLRFRPQSRKTSKGQVD
jgi:hypothetical protein